MNQNITDGEFEKYFVTLYQVTLLNSLIFSDDVDVDLNLRINNRFDSDNCMKLLNLLIDQINIYKNENLFDYHIKNNVYFMVNFLLERITNLDEIKKNTCLNSFKILLNNCSENNIEFIKQQYSIRDYGCVYNKFNPKLFWLSTCDEEHLNEGKNTLYNSISFDVDLLNILLYSEGIEKVYEQNAESFLLTKQFYRSLNYFLVTNVALFYNNNLLLCLRL